MKNLKALLQAAKYLPIYAVCIVPVVLLWQRPVTLTLVYIVASAGVLLWRRRPTDLIYFLVPGILGPAGEFFAVRAGAWAYAGEHMIPLWLPFAWGLAGLAMMNISEALLQARDSEVPEASDASSTQKSSLLATE